MHAHPLPATIAITAVLIALVTDLRERKIFNWLTLPLLVIGPAVRAVLYGWTGVGEALLGELAMAGFLFVLVLLGGRAMGGGDLKLLVGLGGLLGLSLAPWLLIYTCASGLVVAVPVLLWNRCGGAVGRNLVANLTRRMAGERELSLSAGSAVPRVPYGVCILLGTLLALLHGPAA